MKYITIKQLSKYLKMGYVKYAQNIDYKNNQIVTYYEMSKNPSMHDDVYTIQKVVL